MAKTKKETAIAPLTTRAEKKDAAKGIIREVLSVKACKHNELIDEVAKLYTQRYGSEETENVNDVKGRIGSVLDIMKKESDVAYEGGMYALKARLPIPEPAKEPVKETGKEVAAEKAELAVKKTKTTHSKAKKETAEEAKTEVKEEKTEKPTKKKTVKKETAKEATEEKPAPKKRAKGAKEESTSTEKVEKPKKTARVKKSKAEEKPTVAEEIIAPQGTPMIEEAKPVEEEKPAAEEKKEVEKVAETERALAVKEKAEVATKGVVMDMSFLFGGVKQPPKEEKKEEPKKEEKKETATEVLKEAKAEEKPVIKEEKKETSDVKVRIEPKKGIIQVTKLTPPTESKEKALKPMRERSVRKTAEKPLTANEKLCESFLKRLRSLGGDYFEYYSVYLLERYSIRNGRRLEGLRISGGDHDGGIDGEIELTDKLGFRETIYIQSKNWNPEKGNEKLWVVGETLLQQFLGACMYRQARDGKQNCRGIFITTSRFTPEAKRILEEMSDKIVGYDGNDLFEAAKECEFGLIKRGGEWTLDERLLSGTKAFFNLF